MRRRAVFEKGLRAPRLAPGGAERPRALGRGGQSRVPNQREKGGGSGRAMAGNLQLHQPVEPGKRPVLDPPELVSAQDPGGEGRGESGWVRQSPARPSGASAELPPAASSPGCWCCTHGVHPALPRPSQTHRATTATRSPTRCCWGGSEPEPSSGVRGPIPQEPTAQRRAHQRRGR